MRTLHSNVRLDLADIQPLATDMVHARYHNCCQALSSPNPSGAVVRHLLAVCWGLLALDPLYRPFALLLNRALASARGVSPTTNPLAVEFAKLAIDAFGVDDTDTESLLAKALSSSPSAVALPGTLIVEAAHRIVSHGPSLLRFDHLVIDDNDCAAVRSIDWVFPAEGLALRHLLLVTRASDGLGNSFPGRDLGALFAKNVVALCWTLAPPLHDPLWRAMCVDLMVTRYAGYPVGTLSREDVFIGMPMAIERDFYRQLRDLDADDCTSVAAVDHPSDVTTY